MTKQITVLAATSLAALDANGADVEYGYFETLKQAKERARYYLTDAYRQASEASVLLGYAQVLVNGNLHSEFFAKEGK